MTWLILHIHHLPQVVANRLERDGHESFNPTYPKEITYKGKTGVLQCPLYHGYLFLAYSDRWAHAQRIDGVITVLRAAEDNPHLVPDEIVDGLRVIPNMPSLPKQKFNRYDLVRITCGAWEGLLATYNESLSNGERSVVHLDKGKGLDRVKLPTSNLELVIAATPPAGQSAVQPKSA